MPSDFTVDWASPASDPYDTPGGKNVAYTIKLKEDGQNRNVMLAQKPDTPAPFPGQSLFGEVISKEKRNGQGTYWKFQKAQRDGGNYNAKKQDKPFERQPTPPGDAAAMRRCHSQEMAIATLRLAAELGVTEKVAPGIEDVNGLLRSVKALTDRYEDDIQTAVASALLSVDDAQRRSEDGF